MSKDAKQTAPASTIDSGVGLDCGTMNFVSARKDGKKVLITRIRDVFLDLQPEHKRMLRLSGTDYVEMDGRLLVIGDRALETANVFNREARRPMSAGVIASAEIDAQQVIGLIMKQTLGAPRVTNEKCCYSVPAPAIDVPNSSIVYHSAILGKILAELGYSAEPVNEAMAVIFSECAKENFSGLAISYGSGMTNVCLSYNAMPALEFSLGRGGDWIDTMSAAAVGTTAARICALKESGVDITAPISREDEAISLHLQALIDYTIDRFIAHFSKAKSDILVMKPIPIIVSGGTSLAKGFLTKFRDRFETQRSKFPIEVSEIRAAADPLHAVANGLLVLSQADD